MSTPASSANSAKSCEAGPSGNLSGEKLGTGSTSTGLVCVLTVAVVIVEAVLGPAVELLNSPSSSSNTNDPSGHSLVCLNTCPVFTPLVLVIRAVVMVLRSSCTAAHKGKTEPALK